MAKNLAHGEGGGAYSNMVDDQSITTIRLDPEKIEYNPGLRSLAKLMLNSLWGMLFYVFLCNPR